MPHATHGHAIHRLFLLAALALPAAACGADEQNNEAVTLPTATEQVRSTGATVYTYDYGDVRIHSYSNDEAHVNTGNHLIEGPNSIVIVDVSFQADVAADLAALAAEIGKPIERIILTHDHPDHWLGICYGPLADVPVWATPGTIESIAGPGGDQFFALFTSGARELFGEPPTAKRTPTNPLPEGSETIDGIRFEYTVWADIEAEEQVVIRLPEYDVLLAGDLMYNQVHPVVGPVFTSWKDTLATLSEQSSENTLVLPGHGAPTTAEGFAELTGYFEEAEAAFLNLPGPDSWVFTMLGAYSDYFNGPFLLPLSSSILYGGTEVPQSASLTGEPWPESIELHDQRVYASNWERGGINYVDLRDPDAGTQVFVPADPDFPAFWGLKAEPATNRLWALANAGSFAREGSAQLRAYDAITAELVETVDLPEATLANDLEFGPDGSIYVTDVSAKARVIRVAPDRTVEADWLRDATAWPAASGFGLGGLSYANGGLYVAAEGTLWFSAVTEGRAPEAPRALTLDDSCDLDPQTDGVQLVFDGLATDGFGNLFGAFNDVQVPGANGALIQVTLTDPMTGTCTTRLSDLADPSGVAVRSIGFATYVLVAESQFGFLDTVGPVDEGSPRDPWTVRIQPL